MSFFGILSKTVDTVEFAGVYFLPLQLYICLVINTIHMQQESLLGEATGKTEPGPGAPALHGCGAEIRRHDLQLREADLVQLMAETPRRSTYPERMKTHVRKRVVAQSTRQLLLRYSMVLYAVATARGMDSAEAFALLNPLALFGLQPPFGLPAWDEIKFAAAATKWYHQRTRLISVEAA